MTAATPRRRLSVLLAMDAARAKACMATLDVRRYAVSSRSVANADELMAALRGEAWSVLLLDADATTYPLADLGRYEREICCDVPIVVFADTFTPELAITWMQQGARDCLRWRDAGRLATVVEAILAREDDRLERRRADEQRHQTERIETIATLAGEVAHDFNNLLTAISGSTELLRLVAPKEPIAEKALATIEQAVAQASRLTGDLQSLSQRAPAPFAPLDLRELLERSLGIIRQMLPSTIELCPSLDPGGEALVEGDHNQLQQMLLHLVLNARDAMPGGGKLRLALQLQPARTEPGAPAGDRVGLEVQDTGQGMTPDVRARIFEPFFTTKTRDRGAGLGLTIVRGIVKNHNGRLQVESAPGEGTTFTVDLPATRRRAAGEEAAPRSLTRGCGELVVLTEERAYVREIMASALGSLGYRVLTAADGETAYRLIRESDPPPHLVVLDADASGNGGVNCIRRLRADENYTPAVLTTAQPDLPLEGAAGERAIVLRKPYQITELARLMRRMLDAPPESVEL